jgi:NADPH:quinone reductase
MIDPAARAVRFDSYGDRCVLYVTETPMPVAQSGEVLIQVRAAGINPGETNIPSGHTHGKIVLIP